MDHFDIIQDIWKSGQAVPAAPAPVLRPTAVNSRRKLRRQQFRGALSLLLTGAWIVAMGLLMRDILHAALTWTGLALVVLVCWMQSFLYFRTYKKLRSIDDTSTPAVHLSQWKNYYAFRKAQVRWNLPLYFVLLNMAMALYLVEILSGRPLKNILFFLLLYAGWMLFAYFYIGKKSLQKEEARISSIVSDLESIEHQWQEE